MVMKKYNVKESWKELGQSQVRESKLEALHFFPMVNDYSFERSLRVGGTGRLMHEDSGRISWCPYICAKSCIPMEPREKRWWQLKVEIYTNKVYRKLQWWWSLYPISCTYSNFTPL